MSTLTKKMSYFCPICLNDTEEDFHQFDCCEHGIHNVCMTGLTSFRCPMCNLTVSNYPDEINIIIDQNASEYKTEVEEYELELFNQMYPVPETFTPSPLYVVIKFFQWLYAEGFHPYLFPTRVTIRIKSGSNHDYTWIASQLRSSFMRRVYEEISAMDAEDIQSVMNDETNEDVNEEFDQDLYIRPTITIIHQN